MFIQIIKALKTNCLKLFIFIPPYFYLKLNSSLDFILIQNGRFSFRHQYLCVSSGNCLVFAFMTLFCSKCLTCSSHLPPSLVLPASFKPLSARFMSASLRRVRGKFFLICGQILSGEADRKRHRKFWKLEGVTAFISGLGGRTRKAFILWTARVPPLYWVLNHDKQPLFFLFLFL